MWLKEVAPSTELRKWYSHDVQKYQEFRHRYETELHSESAQSGVAKLREIATKGQLTLVFATRDPEHSSAIILQNFLIHHS
jgi:uncharacterized protein YeaO (DUF488 family)